MSETFKKGVWKSLKRFIHEEDYETHILFRDLTDLINELVRSDNFKHIDQWEGTKLKNELRDYLSVKVSEIERENKKSTNKTELYKQIDQLLDSWQKPEVHWYCYSRVFGIEFDIDKDEKGIKHAEEFFSRICFGEFELIKMSTIGNTNRIMTKKFIAQQEITINKIQNWTHIMNKLKTEDTNDNYFIYLTITANNAYTTKVRLQPKIKTVLALLTLLHQSITIKGIYYSFQSGFRRHRNETQFLHNSQGSWTITHGNGQPKARNTHLIPLTPKVIELMQIKYNSLSFVHEILKIENNVYSKYQNTVMRSFYWYHEGVCTDNLNYKLTSLVYCLENLFVPEKNITKKSYMLSFRIMLFQHKINEHFTLPGETEYIYLLRSNIAHGSLLLEYGMIDSEIEGKFKKNYYEKDVRRLFSSATTILLDYLKFISNNSNIKSSKNFIMELYKGEDIESFVDWIIEASNESDFTNYFKKRRRDIVENNVNKL